MYGSSYVMLTYATRTLSNSIELVLTAALLYFASRCMAYSEKVRLIFSKMGMHITHLIKIRNLFYLYFLIKGERNRIVND